MLIPEGTLDDTGKSFNTEHSRLLWSILHFATEEEQTLETFDV